MAKTTNLNDFLKDLADGIRVRKGTLEPINAQDMRAEIERIALEQTDKPKEIINEAEMDALLLTADIGSVYKYTGTTGKYENGAIYIVEAVE